MVVHSRWGDCNGVADMLAIWKDEYGLGYNIIDSGHRLVIEAINRLNQAGTPDQGRMVVAQMLPALEGHLIRQFEHEGAMMRLARSPAQIEHEAEHLRLLTVLAVLSECHQRGGEAADLLLLNLVCFLAAHLRGTDADTFACENGQCRAA